MGAGPSKPTCSETAPRPELPELKVQIAKPSGSGSKSPQPSRPALDAKTDATQLEPATQRFARIDRTGLPGFPGSPSSRTRAAGHITEQFPFKADIKQRKRATSLCLALNANLT